MSSCKTVSVGRAAHPDAPEQKLASYVSPQSYLPYHIDIDDRPPIPARLCTFCNLGQRREIPLYTWNPWIRDSEYKNLHETRVYIRLTSSDITGVEDPWALVALYRHLLLMPKKPGLMESKVRLP